uniref:C2H2-type domain-containing protein n=1 Tax=Brugia timori TaxID=42155 RepID=A0A0R3QKR0_9BILA
LDQANLNVSESYCSSKYFFTSKSKKGSKTSPNKFKDNQEILSLVLKSYLNKQPKVSICSVTLSFPNTMDLQQQRLLAEILQQPEPKTLRLKVYQTTPEHQQQQILNSDITANNSWFASFAMQRNRYPNFMSNLDSSAFPLSPNSHQIFSGFNSMVNTNYLPAVASSTIPLLNIPLIEETQIDELAGFLVVDELQKMANSSKQTWQNLMQHQEIHLPRVTIAQHGLYQQVPSVSSFMKRWISESLQQQAVVGSTQMTTAIKRARVIVIEPEMKSAPCCSSNVSSENSTVRRMDWSKKKIKKLGSHIYGKRKGRNIKCDIGNQNDNVKKEDAEDVQYVDVESVDEKLDSKEQRKALIEFYRKVKTIRMSYATEDLLICQMCEQKVQNSDSLILIHLYGHAEVMPYRCKMCGASECQLERIYAHIKQGHPNKDPSITYENRRNMAQLISLLRTCFPRNITKTKATYCDLIDKICAVAKKKSLAKLTCVVCRRKISTRKESLVRHGQAHLHYRCRNCGIILFDETTIVEHCTKKHGVIDPQRRTHYDACVNTSDKREIALKNCFGNILDEKA